ncbi:uncharacterized protein [Henckelia pumila]|uniref:uncharacterized protein n=1 Tax=Henckelia pumila TaxID=405737 RepID=UPI003C6E66DE
MQAEEADPDTSLITGRILVGENSTYALLDSRATHSFISLEFIRRMGIRPEVAEIGYDVTMPSGQILSTTSICRDLEMDLQGHTIRIDLVVLPLIGFDLILGMEWLAVNGAVIDFRQRTVAVKPVGGDQFVFFASQSSRMPHVISHEEIQRFGLEYYSGGHAPSLEVLVVHPNLRDRIRDGQPADEELHRLMQKDEAKGGLLYTVVDGIV